MTKLQYRMDISANIYKLGAKKDLIKSPAERLMICVSFNKDTSMFMYSISEMRTFGCGLFDVKLTVNLSKILRVNFIFTQILKIYNLE